MWSEGDAVLFRGLFRGRVRWAFPYRFVGRRDDVEAFVIRPGTPGRLLGYDRHGHYIADWVARVPPREHVWAENRVLRLVRRGEAHILELVWHDATGEFRGWHVNLQDPVTQTARGYDTVDHALDVWVHADGRWEWKDEDDFAQAQELGAFTAEEAAAIRAEGERVVAAWPFPTGWEDFTPDPAWPIPELPDLWQEPCP